VGPGMSTVCGSNNILPSSCPRKALGPCGHAWLELILLMLLLGEQQAGEGKSAVKLGRLQPGWGRLQGMLSLCPKLRCHAE
jgi:hypothetical protein